MYVKVDSWDLTPPLKEDHAQAVDFSELHGGLCDPQGDAKLKATVKTLVLESVTKPKPCVVTNVLKLT